MKFLQSIKMKLIITSGLLVLIPSLIIGLIEYYQANESLNNLGKESIKDKVTIAIATIDLLQEKVENGDLSLEEAQQLAKSELIGPLSDNGERNHTSSYRFGPDGYLSIIDDKGNFLAHPKLEGQNYYDQVDSNGIQYIKDFIDKAQQSGGYTEYIHADSEKIAYTTSFEKWGWVISGGAYFSDFNKPATKLLYTLFITLIVVSIIGLIFVYFVVNRITKPILRVRNHMLEVSEGNLKIDELQLNRNDELGDLAKGFNVMLKNLKSMVENIQSHSEQVAATSEELSASAQQSSVASEQVAEAIQNISEDTSNTLNGTNHARETVQEISYGIEEITKNVQDLSSSATETEENASSGFEKVNLAKDQMHKIQDSSKKMSDVILSLGNTSKEIGSIISLIENVADQTNLLALNAAIEAARAGEHGKGFAVVANEVRKLAEQSQKATNQVSQLITDIQSKVEQTIVAMNEGENEVNTGRELVDSAGQSFTQIQLDIENVASKIQMINSSIQEINAGSDELVHTIKNAEEIAMKTTDNSATVAATAQEQSASVVEITSASESLASMAEELQQIIGKFKI